MAISQVDYLILFAITFLVVGVLTPIARRVAIKHNVMDAPTTAHKTHKNPVPYLGGVAIIIGISIVPIAALLWRHAPAHNFWLALSVIAPALVLGLIGLWDDLHNLSALSRFIAQTLAGIFTASLLVISDTVGNPTGSRFFDIAITILWIVGISNSINFFDNLDGGAAGTVAVTSLGLILIGNHNHQYFITSFASVTAGAMIGFLLWNKSPARIYMGDAGALFLGVLIASLTVRVHPDVSGKLNSFAVPLLLLGTPILDTSVAVTSRLKRRISPFQGGRDHLSHRLIRAGVTRPIAAVLLWILSGFFALCAALITMTNAGTGHFLIAIALTAWVGLFIFFIRSPDSDS